MGKWNPTDLKVLIAKYNAGEASVSEQKILEAWYNQIDQIDNRLSAEKADQIKQEAWSELANSTGADPLEAKTPKIKLLYSFIKWSVAASLIILPLLYFYNAGKTPTIAYNKQQTDVLPGTNKAILTLSDGSTVALEKGQERTTLSQYDTKIVRSNNLLVYKVKVNDSKQTGFNTITTPRGGEYELILPDGTHVWLNSGSSLNFPVNFVDNRREVKLTGEAYFEVAKNLKQPFIVNVNGKQEVKVLGTHFNIMAYNDESLIKTTLLEGSVSLSINKHHQLLKPGQQLMQAKNGDFEINNDVDLDDVVAWKDGVTVFNNKDIYAIMREISRWYDVPVEYKGAMPNRLFTGGFSRKSKLLSVLRTLEKLSNIKIVLNGDKITVSP